MSKSMIGLGPRVIGCGLTLAAIAATFALTTGRVTAQDGGDRRCSEQTLQGDYGFLVSGFKPVPPPLGGGLERFNAVGIYSFDGNGTFTFEPGGALTGEITGLSPDPTNSVGTYEINANCTGTMSWQPNLGVPVLIKFTVVVVDNAREVKLAGTTGLSQGEAVRR
jgi:hypothetical protein